MNYENNDVIIMNYKFIILHSNLLDHSGKCIYNSFMPGGHYSTLFLHYLIEILIN